MSLTARFNPPSLTINETWLLIINDRHQHRVVSHNLRNFHIQLYFNEEEYDLLITGCRFGDGNHLVITFSVEREGDIGHSLRQSQTKFVDICFKLLNDHKDDIFDVHRPQCWYQSYTRSKSLHISSFVIQSVTISSGYYRCLGSFEGSFRFFLKDSRRLLPSS